MTSRTKTAAVRITWRSPTFPRHPHSTHSPINVICYADRFSRNGARAFFAEGLCLSYEAFHHTRESRGDVRDVDDDGIERVDPVNRTARCTSIIPVSWYEEQIARLIPSKSAPDEVRCRHSKISPVVRRAVDLWRNGEKVLVFCFYRETAKALRQHIGREVEKATLRLRSLSRRNQLSRYRKMWSQRCVGQ